MAEKAADFVLNQEKIQEVLPTTLIRRKSLNITTNEKEITDHRIIYVLSGCAVVCTATDRH